MKKVAVLLLLPIISSCIGLLNGNKQDHQEALIGLGLLGAAGQSGVNVGGGAAGPSGISLTSSDGRLIINIPPGAMTEVQEFTITRYTPSSNALPGQYFPTTPAYEISPSYVFQKDVTVSVSLDISTIVGLNLDQQSSQGFSSSSTSPDAGAERFPDWQGQVSHVDGDRLIMNTRTFSIFGGGTPPAGNLPPTILGAFYSFEPSLSYVPERVRAQVIEPEGNTMSVYLLTGPIGGPLNLLPLVREGGSNWYSADLPLEALGATGVTMQVIAVDQFGANSKVPSAPFQYPASSGNATFIGGYDRDQDGDGYLDSWERDNGFNPHSTGSPFGIVDSDGDGIPNSGDFTPNGEANPVIDSLSILPNQVGMDIGESVSFGVSASVGGAFRFVSPSLSVSGLGSVGTLNGAIFTADQPGVTAITATVGTRNAAASISVRDSQAPGNILDLNPTAMSHSRIRLSWTAPGDDGNAGAAAAYEVRRSTSPILSNAQCDAASAMAHGLSPKPAGIQETLDINGLSPSTTYYFCVRAFDSDGNRNSWTQGAAAATTMAMPDLTAPADVAGAMATATAGDRIRLDWTSVGDDGNSGTVSAYEIRRSTSAILNNTQCDGAVEVLNDVSPAVAGNPQSFIITGLSENTIYYFCIRAFDDANNRSNWTGSLAATTKNNNDAPIADAGADQSVSQTGGVFPAVVLNGSATSDPDAAACAANPASYTAQWTVLSSPGGSTATVSNATSLTNASLTPDVAGDYLIQLEFTDDAGLCSGGAKSSTDTISVHASATVQMGGALQGSPLTLTRTVTTLAGVAGSNGSADGIGSAARLHSGWSVTSDGPNVYFTDIGNHTIRKIVIATGAVTTIAGAAGSAGSGDGTGSAARFYSPIGITTDGSNLFVSELNNHTIRKIVIATGVVTTLAGAAGSPGSADGTGAAARFRQPHDLTTDGTYVYVSDSGNHTIRRIAIATGVVTTLAGSAGSAGSGDGTGAAARFYLPIGITTDGVHLYVPDAGNSTIRKIAITSGVVTTLAGTAGSSGSADGTGAAARFSAPQGITSDGTNLYLTDTGNYTIRKIVIATGVVTTIAGSPGVYGATDGIGSAASFQSPWGIATNGSGLFVQSGQTTIRQIQ